MELDKRKAEAPSEQALLVPARTVQGSFPYCSEVKTYTFLFFKTV
jgi:hypothetical protein